MFFDSRPSIPFSSAVRKFLGFVLCLVLAIHAPIALAAQHTSRKPSPSSSAKPAAKPSTANPIRALQVTPSGDTIGSPWTGERGVSETTEQIMQRERALGSQRPKPDETETEKILPLRDRLPVNPLSPQESQWPPKKNEEPPRAAVFAAQSTGLSFTGATLSETGAFPPDTMGAVGPAQFGIAVNNRIKVFDKATGALGALNSDANVFFNSVRNGITTSDPRIRYDRLSGRWFIIIINVFARNRVLLAVSDSGTITGSTVWTFFFFRQDEVSPAGESGCFSDYPTLGIDANALYIGVNQFCPSFGGTTAFIVRKSSVLGSGPIVVSAFRNLTGTAGGAGLYTPQGVDNYDPAATEGYFIGVDNASFGTLVVRRVGDPGGTPVLSPNAFITVPTTSFPLTVPHQGNNNGVNGQLDALDDRLFAAHIRNGHLWTAQNISVDNTGTTVGVRTRNAARWYELAGLNTGAPTLVQAGTLFASTPTNSPDDRHYWMPSIMVSGQGHVAMGMSAGGTNEFVNAATVGRLAADPLGTMQTPILYTLSTTPYNPPGNTGDARGRRRWGDYSYTSLDPCDDMTLWTIQQFCDTTDSYGVRVVKLIAPPPVTPLSANPAIVPQGQSSINVTVEGASTGGSGFYDPGPGFGCRLAASIGGGVVVNSVSYNNATSITLNISTVSAGIGAKGVTVRNPDGQSASGAGLLNISSAGSCSYTLNPTSRNFAAGGGTGSVNVTTSTGCAWTATNSESWIAITSGGSGTGNGTVNYAVSPNTGGGTRTGTITAGGVNFVVTQDGTGACTFSIAPTSQNFVVGGGTGSVTVATPTGCAWTAASNVTWINIASGASGSGNGTVNYSVSANANGSPRTGTMTIAGVSFTVTQDPAPCTFTIAPTSQNLAAGGGSGSVSVTTPAGCAWGAMSNDSWINITSVSSSTGSGTVNYSVGAHAGINSRTGTMTIAGRTFTISQSGSSCTFSVSPTTAVFESIGGSGIANVTASGGCAWTAASNDNWITITSGANGAGNGPAAYSVAANTTSTPRVGMLTVAGRLVTVTQSGITCVTAISPFSVSIGASGGTANIGVTAPVTCSWTATSGASWITITANAGGAGNKTIKYTVAPNSGATRIGTVTVRGRLHTVTQAGTGTPCTFTISPTSRNFSAAGGTSSASVIAQAGCSWTAASNDSWIIITSGSTGTGSGAVNYSVAANIAAGSRAGSMTIAGQSFTVTQDPAAPSCTFLISPTSQNFGPGGGTGSIAVTTQTTCVWSAVSNAGWVTITSGSSATGSGSVNYSVAANPATNSRSGTMTVAGQTFNVSQDAAAGPCTFSITPNGQNFASTGGTGTVQVTTQTGCGWTATSNDGWITITAGSSGTGSGSVSYSVASNPNTSLRTGTMTVAGHSFTVTQSGAPGGGCAHSISPSGKSISNAGGSGTVSVAVTAGSACSWTAVSNAGWITITAGSSGTGNGLVVYVVSANTTGVGRTGTITIAARTFTVKQGA